MRKLIFIGTLLFIITLSSCSEDSITPKNVEGGNMEELDDIGPNQYPI